MRQLALAGSFFCIDRLEIIALFLPILINFIDKSIITGIFSLNAKSLF